MHIITITTSFPATENDYSGVFIRKTLERMDIHSDIIVPADIRDNHNPCFKNGTVHWIRYAPRRISLITSSQGGGGIPENLKRNPGLVLLLPVMIFFMFLKAYALTNRNSIIHAHWLINGIPAFLIKSMKGNSFVLTIRGSDQKLYRMPLFRGFARRIFRHADAITTVSKMLKDEISEKFQIGDKTYFIPNGTDTPPIPEKSAGKGFFKFLFVGSFTMQKGVYDLIHAMDQLAQVSNWELQMIGAGREMQALIDLAAKSKAGKRIRFSGQVSPVQIQKIMIQSNCLILPSYSEGTPNVIKEAMACALPVIATRIGGIPELVVHGVQGLLFKPGDVATLKKHILFLLKNREAAVEMGKKGRYFIRHRGLTWENTAKEYASIYGKLR